MYCSKCGNMLSENQAFCDKCGQKAGEGVRQHNVVYIREKSEGVAAVLSFLWAGAGQIYAGKIVRGLGIILAYTLFAIVTFAFIFSALLPESPAELTGAGIALLICVSIGMIVLWVWNIFDAYNLAKEYNGHVRAGGEPPW